MILTAISNKLQTNNLSTLMFENIACVTLLIELDMNSLVNPMFHDEGLLL